ncbi:hypothetical protein BJ508DRAFT_366182 [Ascobolus immersus RN42]|uniref:DUF7580 domain-containing protein n=1 Tax=Ascobolus immersus RN42 TaxID=1160509 RepID=A0A3N4HMS3_ASCIM|nr:hypothetical protein BJ508DRAFT_366182 [Ascobolus immersus RN42]
MEAAGLALAVFPLLITAIEHWEGMTRSTRSLFRWQRELQTMCRELAQEHLRFRVNLSLLLSPVVASKVEILRMLDNPSSELWHGQRGLELKEKLGIASTEYLNVVVECERLLRDVWRQLELSEEFCDISKDKRDQEAIKQAFRESLEKVGKLNSIKASVKFLRRKQRVTELISNLHKNNDLLGELEHKTYKIDSNCSLSTSNTKYSRSLKSFLSYLNTVRSTAKALHQTLVGYSNCTKHISHNLNLELADPHAQLSELEGNKPYGSSEGQENELHFRFLLMAYTSPSATDAIASQMSSKMEWAKETIISLEQIEEAPIGNLGTLLTAGNARSTSAENHSAATIPTAVHNAVNRSVQFNLPLQAKAVQTHQVLLSTALTEVQNLCAPAFHRACRTDLCLHLRIHQDKLLHNANYDEPSRASQFETVVSLHGLLRLDPSRACYLPPNKRYAFAARITCSLLHLHSSPWITESLWSSRSIFVCIDKDGEVSDPYISQPFSQDTPSPDTDPSSKCTNAAFPPAESLYVDLNPVLLAMGILLLELGLGKPIEAIRSAQHRSLCDTPSPMELHTMAYSVAKSKEFQNSVSRNYIIATEKCISSHFKARPLKFSDPEFQLEYCEEVVKPMLLDYCYFNGKKAYLER